MNVWTRLSVSLLGLFFFVINCFVASAQNFPPRTDDQFWFETQITKSLTEHHDLIVTGQVRQGREFHHPVEEQIGVGLAFKLNSWLTVTPAYTYVDQQPYAGRRVSQHRLVFNLTGKLKLGEFTFTDRNVIERRMIVANRDYTVYRNRLQIDHPAHLGEFKFKPFIYDEVRYSTQTVGTHELDWYRNRLAIGISKQISQHLTTDFFYLRQNDGISRPGNINALGTTFRIFL